MEGFARIRGGRGWARRPIPPAFAGAAVLLAVLAGCAEPGTQTEGTARIPDAGPPTEGGPAGAEGPAATGNPGTTPAPRDNLEGPDHPPADAKEEKILADYLAFEVPYLVKDLERTRSEAARRAYRRLEDLGSRARDALADGLSSPVSEAKVSCIELLGKLKDPANNDLFLRQIEIEKDFRVMQTALLALVPGGKENLVPPILAAMEKGNRDVRPAAAQALAQVGRMADLKLLFDQGWLKKPDPLEQQWQRDLDAWLADPKKDPEARPERPPTYRDLVARALEKLTGERFGFSEELWIEWWNSHKDTFKTKADEVAEAAAASAPK